MAPYLVLLGTQNLDERTIQDLSYWEYECHFGFPSYQFGEDCGYEMEV